MPCPECQPAWDALVEWARNTDERVDDLESDLRMLQAELADQQQQHA
jgi:hypothetical protein